MKYWILTLLRFFHHLLLRTEQTMKLVWFQSKWRTLNRHNRTIPDTFFDMERVKVGKETYARLNVHSYGSDNEELIIGNYCSIAENVHFILGGGHDYLRFSTYPFQAYFGKPEIDAISKGPIHIEDDVWIGFGVTVLSGVTIGRGAVIAAGSIVTKDVPPYAIWIGNGVYKMRFDEMVCNALQNVDFERINPKQVRESIFATMHVAADNVNEIVASVNCMSEKD